MGFFTRLIQGKPIYNPNDISNQEKQMAAEMTPGTDAKKVVPVANITRIKTDMNGQRMDIYGYIQNESDEPLTLWSFHMGGIERNLQGSNLSVGENQETLLYSGAPWPTQPRGDAELVYRTSTGNNFLAYHRIRGRMEQGMFVLTDLNLQLPIRDVQ